MIKLSLVARNVVMQAMLMGFVSVAVVESRVKVAILVPVVAASQVVKSLPRAQNFWCANGLGIAIESIDPDQKKIILGVYGTDHSASQSPFTTHYKIHKACVDDGILKIDWQDPKATKVQCSQYELTEDFLSGVATTLVPLEASSSAGPDLTLSYSNDAS